MSERLAPARLVEPCPPPGRVYPPVMVTVVWLRRDLRLADNAALFHAAARGAVVPVYLHAPEEEGGWAPGAASRVWLHHALGDFAAALRACGSTLVVRRGDSLASLLAMVRETGATAVFWNRRYEPLAVAADARIKAALRGAGLEARSFGGALLTEPTRVRNRQGGAFRVFTAFHKHCRAEHAAPVVLAAPARLVAPARWPQTLPVGGAGLTPRVRWDGAMMAGWEVGEAGARRAFATFADSAMATYGTGRDRPAECGVSRLSPYLHFGHVSPGQLFAWAAGGEGADDFVRQLYWRDFAHHLLFHFPTVPDEPLNPAFARFAWRRPASPVDEQLCAWREGATGYPLVDAGMRELWRTGWMHNRVRMNVGSFLVKHLLVHWSEGARWFWDTLLDADLANNTMGWQWVAGCGADAAPYFRIFNPTLQGKRFDPDGDYIRRWVPELAALPARWIHEPAEAPAHVLRAAGVTLGPGGYPRPVVEHRAARTRALDTLAGLRAGGRQALRQTT